MGKIAHNVKEVGRLAVWMVVLAFGIFLGAFIIVGVIVAVGILLVLAI